ncbi:hypothetical protein, partial [Arcticibacter svalbardensis]|uniref:hypothetical protein n=1 Tax=Arcticibacter svalbardensis TaxID=1288027 RepID=UPI001F160BE0
MLHSPTFNEGILKERGTLIELFSNNSVLAQKVQLELHKLNTHLTYSLPNLIFDWKFERLRYKIIIILLSIVPIFLILLGVYYN